MQTPVKSKMIAAAILVVGFGLVACGKTNRSAANDTSSGTNLTSTGVSAPPVVSAPPPPSTTPPAATGTPPLSYEFIALGGNVYTTPAITTDNVLMVKFQVGTTQDNANLPQYNATHQATELAVTISVNGRDVSPTFTTNNYVYGQIGETSAVIDFSSQLTPGRPVTITVKDAKNDFYCTYLAQTCGVLVNSQVSPGWYACGGNWVFGDMVNTLANQYPGCRKPVKPDQRINGKDSPAHRWSGSLIVQTSSTQAI